VVGVVLEGWLFGGVLLLEKAVRIPMNIASMMMQAMAVAMMGDPFMVDGASCEEAEWGGSSLKRPLLQDNCVKVD